MWQNDGIVNPIHFILVTTAPFSDHNQAPCSLTQHTYDATS